ncbi:hypothetical protein SSX86_033075 [Deinandra increscens subsp. villosa]|uniref:SWIM-type domain-containing protein n=1 Tax=Deinandra increscens subsp. villosa TaxID=3103831 RepID=A0AAP0C6X4_9ASTR
MSSGAFIREALDQKEVEAIYVGFQHLFSIKLHHGGLFKEYPGRVYAQGSSDFVDFVDIDKFSVHELDIILERLGHPKDDVRYYHYLVPNKNLDDGLRALGTDSEVRVFATYVFDNKLMNVYVEHDITTFPISYFSSPGNVNIEEIVETNKRVKKPPSFKTMLLCGLEDENVADNREGRSEDMAGLGIDDNLEDVNVTENMEDNLEDVNVTVNMEGNLEHDSSSDDSDFVDDDGNHVNDHEADMRDFRLLTEADHGEYVEAMDEPMLDNDIFDNNERRESESPFYLGQEFGTKKELKSMVKEHAVETKRDIRVIKDELDRVRAICKGKSEDGVNNDSRVGAASSKSDKAKGVLAKNVGGRGKKTDPDIHKCPWVLLLSKNKKSGSWVIKTLVTEHKCLLTRKIYSCTATFLSKKLVEQIKENPTIPVKAVQEQFQRQFELPVSTMKAFRAKSLAVEQVNGDFCSQYGMLRTYVEELMKANPGTTVKLEVQPSTDPTSQVRKFKRIYVCLGSLKQGFKAIGRELLGLDGAFLKGPFPGQILTAVGLDPNNGIYPVAYAIVEAETMLSWSWFLECLGDDLDLGTNSNFTFISDRQKGIIPALKKVFPCAEHRFCLRHILENMKQQYRGKIYKDALWKLATHTTVEHFQKEMDALKEINSEAHLWLSKIPPQHWSRSHFSGRAISDVLLNNMCEVLNSKLLDGRDKPIITMLEFVREYLMRRIVNVLGVIDRSNGMLTPYATKLLESQKKEANRYRVKWNGEDHYQVSGQQGNQYVVNMRTRTCACRKWEITGIPCRHAVAVIWSMKIYSENLGSPEAFVNPVYTMDRWKEVYTHKVYPLNGMSMWSKSQVPTIIAPPDYHKPIGRPKKARKRSGVELEEETRAGGSNGVKTTTCGKCKKKGHNKRSCKGQEQIG